MKNSLYVEGRRKIDKELDIRHVVKELRTLKFIANILLMKYQRQMIPYFKGNLLNYAQGKTKPIFK